MSLSDMVLQSRVDTRDRSIVVPTPLVVWAGLVGLAFLLRVCGLDNVALDTSEAARALEALAIARGSAGATIESPLLTNLVATSMFLFSPSDGSARVPSVLAGIVLCLSPILLRERLGWTGAAGASVLLMVSPVGVLASRSLDPAIFNTAAIALVVGGVGRFAATGRQIWIGVAVAATGLGVASGPSFVGNLLALVTATVLVSPLERALPRAPRVALLTMVGAGAAVAILASTALLARPGGLQAGLIAPLIGWPNSIGFSTSNVVAVGLLAAHDAALIVAALVGLPHTLRTRAGRFLLLWLTLALLVGLLRRSPDLSSWLATEIPLALLAGLGLPAFRPLLRLRRPRVLSTALALLAPLAFLVLALNASTYRAGGDGLPIVALAVVVGGIVAILLLSSVWLSGRDMAVAGAGTVALLVTCALIVALGRLNYGGPERAAPLLQGRATRPEVRLLQTKAMDWRRQDPTKPIYVDTALRSALEWSLRDGSGIEWVSEIAPTETRAIFGPNSAPPGAGGRLVRLVVAERYVLQGRRPDAVWRWLIQGEPIWRSDPDAILVWF